MEKVIGYCEETMFRFNCYVENADGIKICQFQVNGQGEKEEMERIHNMLLGNSFHISKFESADRTIPIIDRG